MSEIRIDISKRKMIFALIGALIFVYLGVAFIINPETFVHFRQTNIVFIQIVGFSSLFFFGFCAIFISIKAFDKKPGLIITEKGIIDNCNFSNIGLINWSEIIAIRTKKVKSTKLILIDLSNPEKFIERNSKVKAFFMRISLKMCGTPWSISSNNLKCNFEKLDDLLNKEFKKYKSTPNS